MKIYSRNRLCFIPLLKDNLQVSYNSRLRDDHGNMIHTHERTGFTIVELLVVIVVIGILAAVTLVSYSGISQRAMVATLQSDLTSSSNKLKMYYTDNGTYPQSLDTNNCPVGPADTRYCLTPSPGNAFTYSSSSPYTSFTLTDTNTASSTKYQITDSTGPVSVAPLTCPSGFIPVPGSSTYGTNDFCVMKYEAKADNGSGIGDTSQTTGYNTWPANTYPISATRQLVSTPQGYPVANISQTTALTAASSYTKNCSSGCHLITEAEWMTIAQNVLSVASNWSGGAVGSGYIYSGHNDSTPATALVADPSDTNGYAGETNTGGNQRRTLTLTNGQVIWDLAGDVDEWAAGTMTGGQPNGMASWSWYEWTAVSGGTFTVNPYPSGTGITGSNTWNSSNGIGKIIGLTTDANLRGFIRGGSWRDVNAAGALTLNLGDAPSDTAAYFGFRVSR